MDAILARAKIGPNLLYHCLRGKEVLDIRSLYDRLSGTVSDILRASERQGAPRKGVDPVELHISASGQGCFYLSNQHPLSTLFKRNLSAPENIGRPQAHLAVMVINYLTREPGPGDWPRRNSPAEPAASGAC